VFAPQEHAQWHSRWSVTGTHATTGCSVSSFVSAIWFVHEKGLLDFGATYDWRYILEIEKFAPPESLHIGQGCWYCDILDLLNLPGIKKNHEISDSCNFYINCLRPNL